MVEDKKDETKEKNSEYRNTRTLVEKERDRRIHRNCGCCAGLFILFMILSGIYIFRMFGPISNATADIIKTPPPVATTQNDNTSSKNTTSVPTQSFPGPQACEQVNTPDAVSLSIIPANPGLKEDTDTYYYSIYGFTYNQIVEQINQCGPKVKGGSWAGLTNWNVNWVYDYAPKANSCGIKNETVGIKIDFYYPKWQQPDEYAAGLAEQWQTYIDGLVVHEEGHKTIGVDGSNRILSALSGLGEYATCNEAATAANNVAEGILNEIKADNENYDATTNHGADQ